MIETLTTYVILEQLSEVYFPRVITELELILVQRTPSIVEWYPFIDDNDN